jgi:hypothetical protein
MRRGSRPRRCGGSRRRGARVALISRAKPQFGDFPLLTAEDMAGAIEVVLERGEPGECWFVQPGRDPAPYGFRGLQGAGRRAAAA